MNDQDSLPEHVEEAVRTIVNVHAKHYHRTTRLQKVVNQATSAVGRPASAMFLSIIVSAWVFINVLLMCTGASPWDPPPFSWLADIASLTALFTTVLILITQRHDDELARHREQLTLELAILSDQKAAKVIKLLEEMRNDSPHLASRDDHEAQAMSATVDPQAMLEAIKDAHASAVASE